MVRAVAEAEDEAHEPYHVFELPGARVMWVFGPETYSFRLRDTIMNDHWRGYVQPPSPMITGSVWWSRREECWCWSHS